jgi:F0F1-type ATP synthase membrane subunit c/vacuolar-type H+-ATPase subunit K
MTTTTNEMKSRLSKLRLFHVAFIASVPLYIRFAENIRHHSSSNWTSWHWVVTGLALCTALGGFRLRRRIIGHSEVALAKDVSNPKALKQWEAGQIIGLAFAEAIVLWGVLLRVVLGGALCKPRCSMRPAYFCYCSGRPGCRPQRSIRFDALEIALLD